MRSVFACWCDEGEEEVVRVRKTEKVWKDKAEGYMEYCIVGDGDSYYEDNVSGFLAVRGDR